MQKKYKGFALCKSKRYLTGFTIVELMVVITIIGILATLTTINVVGAKQRANYTKVLSDLDAIVDATRLYQEEYKAWPLTSRGVVPTEFVGLPSSYMATWPTPTCSDYQYDWVNAPNDPDPVMGSTATKDRQGILYKLKDPSTIIYYYDVNNFAGFSEIASQNNTMDSSGTDTIYTPVPDFKTATSITCKENGLK